MIVLEPIDQVSHRRVEDRLARLTTLDRQRDRQVRLPHTGRPQEQHIVVARQKRQIEERGDLLPIQARLEAEVEVIQRLDER
jgi:hypothetical protein